MHKIVLALMILVPGGYAGNALSADIEAGKKLAQAKKCGDCHGAAGISPEGTSYPNLAGQKLAYLKQALTAYRDKDRQHPIMTSMAAGLSDKDIANLAEYFTSLSSCP
jgi:cytochrome c553